MLLRVHSVNHLNTARAVVHLTTTNCWLFNEHALLSSAYRHVNSYLSA